MEAMNATGQFQRSSRKNSGKRVQTVLRVCEEGRYSGDILLDANNRVWRHASTIPPDIVLRVLLSFTRQGEVCGELVRRSDGRNYLWFVVGAVADEVNDNESENEAA
jgi:hypothetical protein